MIFKGINIVYHGKHYNTEDYQRYKADRLKRLCNASKVLIALKRTPDLLFAIMMLLEEEIAFVPVDTQYPRERIDYIVKQAGCDYVLSDVLFDLQPVVAGKGGAQGGIAYNLFTSGSTGTPKGVEVTREGLDNFIAGMVEVIDFAPGKSIACLTTVSFDIFFLESVLALSQGMTVILADETEQNNPGLTAKLIRKYHVEMLQMTPSRMQMLLHYDRSLSCFTSVTEIMIGGEPFPPSLLQEIKQKTQARIFNLYGPTETTIWSLVSELTHSDSIHIGKPIRNTQVYLTDETLQPVKDGQPGEICIGGSGLARGYLGQEELTRERFTTLPQNPDVRVYRTGDIGRYLPDGNLQYLGRNDNQVKIRGYRIEPEEIEHALDQFEGIHQAAVAALDSPNHAKTLTAFYVGPYEVEPAQVKQFLSLHLPDYMIPVRYIWIDEMPYTLNGKLDRKMLASKKISHKNDQAQPVIKKQDESEHGTTARILRTVEKFIDTGLVAGISMDSSLSETGFNSVTYVEFIVGLELEFDMEFEDSKLILSAFDSLEDIKNYIVFRSQV